MIEEGTKSGLYIYYNSGALTVMFNMYSVIKSIVPTIFNEGFESFNFILQLN